MSTVLVAGASRGLGLEFARQYAADGWRVIATARQPEKAEALRRTKAELHALSEKGGACLTNLSSASSNPAS